MIRKCFIIQNRWGRRKAEMDDGPVPWNLKWIIPPEGSGTLMSAAIFFWAVSSQYPFPACDAHHMRVSFAGKFVKEFYP